MGCNRWVWVWIGWPIWVAVMSFPEWGGRGRGQWVMVRAHMLCVYICISMWSFSSSWEITKQQLGSLVGALSLNQNVSRPLHFSDGFCPLLLSWLALLWTGRIWWGFISISSLLLVGPPSHYEGRLSFIQFVCKFDHSCEESMFWDCLSGAKAATGILYELSLDFFVGGRASSLLSPSSSSSSSSSSSG